MHEHNTTPPMLDRYDATHIHTGRWRIALLEARFRTSSRPSADERRLLKNRIASPKAECANVNAEARVASHGVKSVPRSSLSNHHCGNRLLGDEIHCSFPDLR